MKCFRCGEWDGERCSCKDGQTIFHGDCREILPELPKVDLVLTDPPYPDYHVEEYGYSEDLMAFMDWNCRQFVFWSSRCDFPARWSARHVWDKRKGGAGSAYEFIYELNGKREQWVFNYVSIQNPVRANFSNEEYTKHKSQKPVRLCVRLLELSKDSGIILDPFLGSGTTLRACKDLGRRGIGIEIEEKYCEIAAERLRQGVLY